jgi:hypothetical protein
MRRGFGLTTEREQKAEQHLDRRADNQAKTTASVLLHLTRGAASQKAAAAFDQISAAGPQAPAACLHSAAVGFKHPLGSNFDVRGDRLWWRDRLAVLAQTFEMEHDRLAHIAFNLRPRTPGGYAARQVR